MAFRKQPTETDWINVKPSVLERINSGANRLIVDLSGAGDGFHHLLDGGISQLTWLLKLTKQAGGALVLCNVYPRIRSTLELLGFDPFFEIESDLERAPALILSDQQLRIGQQSAAEPYRTAKPPTDIH